MKSSKLIQLKAVDRRHDSGVLALEGLNAHVATGEFVSLVGAAGAGKSSLLRLIAGIDRPAGGEVLCRGALLRATLLDASFVYASSSLMPWANVVTNVELPLRLQGGLAADEREQRARAALAQVGLAESADKLPRDLDELGRMAAALARALVTRPALLLLDDCFQALSEPARSAFQQLVLAQCRQSAERGEPLSVVLATRSADEAVLMGQRVWVLSGRPGQIVDEIKVDPALQRDAAFVASPLAAKAVQRVRAALDKTAAELVAG